MEKKNLLCLSKGAYYGNLPKFSLCLIPFYLCLFSPACFTAPPNPQLWQFPTLAVWNAEVAIQPSFEESKLQRPGIAVIAFFQYRRSIWACNEIRTKLNHLRCSKSKHIHRPQLGADIGIIPFLSPPRGQCFRCLDLGAQTDWNKIVGNGRLRQLHPTLERNWAPWLEVNWNIKVRKMLLKQQTQESYCTSIESMHKIHSILQRPFVYTEFLKMYHKLVAFGSCRCILNPAKTRMERPQSSHPRKHSKPPAWRDAKKKEWYLRFVNQVGFNVGNHGSK